MRIKNIRIQNFKSIYGDYQIDFEKLEGLVKLSGVIGSGKTLISEAIIWGLFGTVKDQKNPDLIAWNTKSCEVEMNIVSKNRNIHILRNIREPLKIEIDGKLLSASNKRNTQEILETEYLDVPKLAIEKMCVISFNAFKSSLANMNPGDTKQFLDNIFGFKTFTQYNDKATELRKIEISESNRLNAVYTETLNQIEHFKQKRELQKKELEQSIDITGLSEERALLIEEGKQNKALNESTNQEYNKTDKELYKKIIECQTLGSQAKKTYNTFKEGKCPTCGHLIDKDDIQHYYNKMMEYANKYRKYESKRNAIFQNYKEKISVLDTKINEIKNRIHEIDKIIAIYNNKVKLLNENYDEIISECENKATLLKQSIDKADIEVGQWSEVNELFTKTLRYNLLETLIPHINNSIQQFINKLDLQFKVKYDQEFKAHIYVDTFEKEISYNNLSTGQKKTLDLAIVFGILQNIISNVECNVLFLDELFSNLDAESRNLMLTLLNETLTKDRCIFIVNHAEMNDDFFAHKIRVSLQNKKITSAFKKSSEEIIVKASKYDMIF